MGIIGGKPGYLILRAIGAQSSSSHTTDFESYYYDYKNADKKLLQFFGNDFVNQIKDKTVIDFGCGPGYEALQLVKMGAARVIGIDIQEKLLSIGRKMAKQESLDDRCTFATDTAELADIIISKDAFEHFADPAGILRSMNKLLKPDGAILISFGPTWLHPYGGHLFSVFPWAHLIFTERALIRWRSDFKTDGATKFSEVEGGLNQITIAQFEEVVAESPCKIEWLEPVPIRGVSLLKNKLFREFGSSIVRCKLVKKDRSL